MAVGIQGHEGVAEIHGDGFLRDFKPASVPIRVGGTHRVGVRDRDGEFGAAARCGGGRRDVGA